MKARYSFSATILLISTIGLAAYADPLPSWNDTETKSRIIEFVDSVSNPASDAYVTPSDRIAVFDNDGTLWGEQPLYFQLIYALDRLKQMAKADPSILTSDVLKAAAAGDLKAVTAAGMGGLLEILNVSHSGISVESYQANVRDWLDTARHPQTGMAYDKMVYQPMLELLSYMRDEGFATYIVSGGGLHFMRTFAEEAYGIPPNQVIGSTTKVSYQILDGIPTIMKDGGIAFVDDKEGKPVGIEGKIGKRPIFAGGNSDGDFQMLEWTTAGEGLRMGLLVHHTDGNREAAYDRDSHIGKLARGLDEGPDLGWLIVDMASDWAVIYPQPTE
jgi:hypothetical protein